MPDLKTHSVLERSPEETRAATVIGAHAEDGSTIDLLELVAVDRVVEQVGEIRKQIEAVVHPVGQYFRRARRSGTLNFGRQ